MAGAYRMVLSRANVAVHDSDGELINAFEGVTASVRDGVARLRNGSREVLAMEQAALELEGRRTYVVTSGEDGVTWTITKPNCCAGGR